MRLARVVSERTVPTVRTPAARVSAQEVLPPASGWYREVYNERFGGY